MGYNLPVAVGAAFLPALMWGTGIYGVLVAADKSKFRGNLSAAAAFIGSWSVITFLYKIEGQNASGLVTGSALIALVTGIILLAVSRKRRMSTKRALLSWNGILTVHDSATEIPKEAAEPYPQPSRSASRTMRFAKWALVCLGLICFLVLIVFWVAESRDRAELTRIAPGEVELADFSLTPLAGEYYRLNGRVRNHSSQYTLTRLELQLTLREVLPAGGLEIVRQTSETLYLGAPAGQSRDVVQRSVHFWNLKPKAAAQYQWDCVIKSIRGE